jgi:hypothetical protein
LQHAKRVVDASFALEGSRSMSGWFCIMHGGAIPWGCRRQELTALSSCEAEYVAMSEVTRVAMWLWKLRPLGGLSSRGPVPVHYFPTESDAQGALALAEHATSNRRSKHIAID